MKKLTLIILSLLIIQSLAFSQTRIPVTSLGATVDPMVDELIEFDNHLFFVANNDLGNREVFYYDGISAIPITDFNHDSQAKEFTVLNNRLYFSAIPFGGSNPLLHYIEPNVPYFEVPVTGSDGADNFIEYQGDIYFQGINKIYKYDGLNPPDLIANDAGHTRLPHLTDGNRKRLFVAGDKLFYNKDQGIHFLDLTQLDLDPNLNPQTVQGTENFDLAFGGDFPSYHIGSKVIANVRDNGIYKLILIDASIMIPTFVNLDLSSLSSELGNYFIQYSDKLFFTAYESDLVDDYVIWYFDESSASVTNFISGITSTPNITFADSDPYILVGNDLYHNSDKIEINTGVPQVGSSECFSYPYFNHTVIDWNNRFYYIGLDNAFNLTSCSTANDVQPETCFDGFDNSINDLIEINGEFFFSSMGPDGNFWTELWKWPQDTFGGICDPPIDNNCLSFDGNNDYLESSNTIFDQIGTGDFTIECWINGSEGQSFNAPAIISNRINGSNGLEGFMMFMHPSFGGGVNKLIGIQLNGLNFILNPNNGSYNGSVLDNTCHHVAISRTNQTELKYYVDGTLIGNYISPSIDYDLSSTQNALIGHDALDNSYFGATVSDIRVWDYARSQGDIDEFKDQYLSGLEVGLLANWKLNEGSGVVANDSSPNSFDAYLGGNANNASQIPSWTSDCCSIADTLCFLDLVIDLDPIPSGIYYAGNSITSSSNVVAGSDVEFHAPTICLNEEFGVENGALFETFIDGCLNCTVTPVCLTYITPVDFGGTITINANSFDDNSSSSCSSTLQFSYSMDANDATKYFDCFDIGISSVDIWITDIYGNQSSCTTTLELLDNAQGDCTPSTLMQSDKN